MKFSFLFAPAVLGLDIQADGVRMLKIKKSRADILIEDMAEMTFNETVFVEGKIKHWANLRAELTDFVRLHGLQDARTVISLPINLVRAQRLVLPTGLHDKEIEAEIYEQLRRDLFGMTEPLAIDFSVLPQKNPAYADVCFVAARQEYLTQYVDCVRAAGLNVKVVDIDVYALTRALCWRSASLSGARAIAYVHREKALLGVFDAHEILFYQQWNIAEFPDFPAEIKQRLAIFHGTFPQLTLTALLVAGGREHIEQMSVERYPYPVQRLKPLSEQALRFARGEASRLDDYHLAFGLALRDLPKW